MYTNAFTLTEILVVVAIIGLLASVVAPNINDAR
ncbi:MAG: prepilin-type N-terminal cleavage/methylation domain-containing protein, partial [Patescibacteria group bacterium]